MGKPKLKARLFIWLLKLLMKDREQALWALKGAFCAVLYADQFQSEREDGKGLQVRTEPIAKAIGNAMVIFRIGWSMTYDEEITDERLEHEVEKGAKALGHALIDMQVTTARADA